MSKEQRLQPEYFADPKLKPELEISEVVSIHSGNIFSSESQALAAPTHIQPSDRLVLLDRLLQEQPDQYSPETIDRVKKLLEHERDYPEKNKPFKLLTDFDDFQIYYRVHPEWGNLSYSEVYDSSNKTGARNFFKRFRKWVKEQTSDSKEQQRLLNKILPRRKNYDLSAFSTLEDWQVEFTRHSEWQGLTRVQLFNAKKSEAFHFYIAFRRWVRQQTADKDERKRLRDQVLPKHTRSNSKEELEEIFSDDADAILASFVDEA